MTTEVIAAIDAKKDALRRKEQHIDTLLEKAIDENDDDAYAAAKNMHKANDEQIDDLTEARRLLVQNPIEAVIPDGML